MSAQARRGPADAPRRMPLAPREVRTAGLALWIVGSVYAVSGLLELLTKDTRLAELRRSDVSLTAAESERAVSLAIAIRLGYALVIAGVAMVSAVKATAGRRWARVTGTVVAGTTGALGLLQTAAGGRAAVLGSVVMVASLAALVLLFRPAASRFFAQAT